MSQLTPKEEADRWMRQAEADTNSLDEHYTSSRYPDAFESQIPAEHYTETIAKEALECAQLLLHYSGENTP